MSSTGLGLKTTHGGEAGHCACIETGSTEHLDIVTTTPQTLNISQTTRAVQPGITVLVTTFISGNSYAIVWNIDGGLRINKSPITKGTAEELSLIHI